jgi:hypothetical protein
MKATEEQKQKMHEWYLKNRVHQIQKAKEYRLKHKNDPEFRKRKNANAKKYYRQNKD